MLVLVLVLVIIDRLLPLLLLIVKICSKNKKWKYKVVRRRAKQYKDSMINQNMKNDDETGSNIHTRTVWKSRARVGKA